MKIISSLIIVLLLSIGIFAQNQKDLQTATARAEKSAELLKQFSSFGQNSVPLELLNKAKAVAVFPDITRVNILLSELTIGNGIVSIREAERWGVPAFLAFKAQDTNLKIAGKKSFDVVLLFMDDQSIEWLKKGDIAFAAGGKRTLALGPVVGGTGTEEILKKANVLYYTMNKGELIDTGLGNDSFFKAIGVLHDNNMNKSIFGMKTKILFAADETKLRIPEKVELFRTVLTEISDGKSKPANQTENNSADTKQ